VTDADWEVAVVGGGPAGCSAGVFLARAGLDVVILDRGRSSIRQCAYLENYLGFPAGIDVETLYDLLHDHAETAGCTIVPDLVESVDRIEGGGFVVDLQERDAITARRVLAATRYDGEYMRGLDDDEAMIETYERDGETHETFARDYAAADGSTPVEGLYVASPSGVTSQQAIVAAGHGARVARRLVTDARVEAGRWEAAAGGVDWVRREAELDGELDNADRWFEWFDEHYGADAPVDPGTERYERVRDAVVADRRSSYVTDETVDARRERGHQVLASHLDPAAVVGGVGEHALLDAIDDDVLREYLDGGE
jgi:hypothetical protein